MILQIFVYYFNISTEQNQATYLDRLETVVEALEMPEIKNNNV